MTKDKNFFAGLFAKKHARETDADVERASTQAPEAAIETSPATADDDPKEPINAAKAGFFKRLADGLSRTSKKLSDDVAAVFVKRKLDAATLEELEELLIASDLGVAAAARVGERLAHDRFDKDVTDAEVKAALAEVVAEALGPFEKPLAIDRARRPHVILVVGVNGAGKTTTIGKLAAKFRAEGLTTTLAAGDTFRAAAVEQLKIWGERTGVPVIAREAGADAAALAHEALETARANGSDILMIDTAGRLQNKRELMDELAKIVRVLKKLDAGAPHDTLLVLDATVGQNAISQATVFQEIAGVSGLVMTKLDGTARGGVLVALCDKTRLPIHFIGVGEGVGDLQPFSATNFARALAGLPIAGASS